MEAMACLLPISRNLPASVTPRCLQASGFSHIDLRVGHHYRTCCRPASDLCRSSRSLLGLHASKVPRSMLASTKRHTNSAFPTLLRSLSSTSVKTSSPGKPSKPPGEQPSQKHLPKKPLLEKTKELRRQIKSLTTHEQIWNVPNVLTLSRLFAAPAVGYLILHDQHAWALGLFAYAGITDLVDGWIARRWQLQTVVGSVVDPMADKLLMAVTVACLAAKGALPGPLAILIFGRDASLAIAAIYYRYASLPTPKTLVRYWDFSLPSAEVHPSTVSKVNTFLQLALIGLTLLFPVIAHYATAANDSESKPASQTGHQSLDAGSPVLVSATTVWSGFSYAILKNAVTILGQDDALKKRQGAVGRRIIGGSFAAVCVAATAWAVFVDGWLKGKDEREE
ncbi:CDP-alcohol phosphatidyltransferase-domain-containing protein [Phyllosticta citricarpa]